MKKNSNSPSHIFVNNFQEKWQKIFLKEDIVRLWLRSWGAKSRSSYALALLVSRGMLMRVARDCYIRSEHSIDDLYWQIIVLLARLHAPSGAVIGGEKALEIHMKNYSIPNLLILYTRSTQARITLVDGRKIHFRTLQSGEKSGRKNLFTRLIDAGEPLDSFPLLILPTKELALLEFLSLREHEVGIQESTLLAFLDREHTRMDGDVLNFWVQYRYIRAMNRLRVVARDQGYDALYQKTLRAIKEQGGGCFLDI